jgi:hypothetical protein
MRAPDVIIGGEDNPYLRRWWLIPRNRYFNIYLHQFLRDDDDRALHGHPWAFNISILLRGGYIEVVPEHPKYAGGASTVRRRRRIGLPYLRLGPAPHRVELLRDKGGRMLPVWTLFITGPNVRQWGFYCPRGWRHWRDFTADDGATVGRGCDD